MEVLDRITILKSGDMLGPYRVLRMLGQGGFGVTYLAIDTNLDREVAIKEYMPELIASRDPNSSVRPRTINDQDAFAWGLSRFLDEARTLAKFRHPNIVQVMAVFEENQTAYMVMDYERGQDLKQVFEEPDNRTESFLKQIIDPIINGLAEVHRHGYIHRDIKPANILIREDNSPVLLDFGSARQAVSSRTQALTALVSVGYAPLEQYNDSSDDQQGPWTDIYALGAVLYFAIVGKPPMDSTLRGSAVLNERPDPLKPVSRMAAGQYSHSFCEAIDWALKFKINDRPQSLNEWRGAMFEDNRTILMPVTGSTGRHGHGLLTSTKTSDIPHTTPPELKVIQENSIQSGQSQPSESMQEHISPTNPRQQRDTRSTLVSEKSVLRDREVQELIDGPAGQMPRRTTHIDAKLSRRKTRIAWFFLSCLCFTVVAVGTWQRERWIPNLSGSNEHEVASFVTGQKQIEGTESNLSIDFGSNSAAKNQSSIDARRVEELRKEEEARRAEEFRQGENARKTEARDKAEKARHAEVARKVQLEEAVLRAQEMRRAEEAKKVQEADQRAEAAQHAKVARRAEEVKKIQEARQREETAQRAEVTRHAEEARKILEARQRKEATQRAEDIRRAEEERQAEVSKRAAEEKEAKKETLDDDQTARQSDSESESFRSISSADMHHVIGRFNALKTALEQKDGIAVKKLTVASERMNTYIDYVFSSFSTVDVKLDEIKVQPGNQSIEAVLNIIRLVRSNGDIAIPPPEYREIQLRSVRDQDWSKILW